MFISELSIRRPVTATMLTVLLVVLGILGADRLGVDYFPDVAFPVVTIGTVWENARPDEIDNDVSDELEDAIGEVSGIKHISTRSMQGNSFIIVDFELTRNADFAAQEIQEKVSSRTGELPAAVQKPVLQRIDVNANPIVWFCLYGRHPIEDLTEYARDVIRPALQKLAGTGQVRLRGAREQEVRIWLDRDRLAAYDLTVSEVIVAIQARHAEVPGGKIESSKKEFLVRTMGEFQSPEAFNELVVAHRNGVAIKLKELGSAQKGREDNQSMARYISSCGTDYQGVGIGVVPRSGSNKVDVAGRAKDEMNRVRALLPPGMQLVMTSDRSDFIEKSIDEVQFHIIVGGLMAAVSIYFFLQCLATTMIASIAIPASLIATFGFMYFMGFTMNNLTMLGMSMAVGLVIDDAIVMVENIYRHRKMGKTALQAALDGSREVGFAVIATTLALVGVFLPVAFMGGIVGKFFKEFALTVAAAIGVSTFIALTLIPMLGSRFLRLQQRKGRLLQLFDRFMEHATAWYRALITKALQRRMLVIGIALAAFVGGIMILSIIGVNFLGNEDEGHFLVRMETPLAYSLEKTDDIVRRVDDILKDISEINNFFTLTGFSGKGDQPQSNQAIAFVTLTEQSLRSRHQEEIMADVRQRLAEVPDLQYLVTYESLLGASSQDADVILVIRGPEIRELERLSRDLMKRLKKSQGFIDIDRDLELGKPEIQADIKRGLCADLGVDVADIAETIGALIGGRDVAEFRRQGKSYDVRVRLQPHERSRPDDLARLRVRTKDGSLAELDRFVTLKHSSGPSVINRLNRQRSVTIYANLEGKVLGDAMPEINALLAEMLPPGYSHLYMGEAEAFQETGYYITIAFFLAVLLTYMVLAGQFESFVHPLTIMAALPLSFVGAFGMLLITGNSFDLFGMIGLVLLVGLVTKNSILLIEFTNQKKAQGLDTATALIEAGTVRLRPILMTAVSTVAGILPVALGLGIGSETRQPMALVVAGGMLSSTLLTLIVIPVIYAGLDSLAQRSVFAFIKRKVFADQ
ncbi:MAG: efflux RND transporter permease subunit [Deltaproteobacteria bacterium]|nr:efflux RND transporter permease subunit [Deltaproteobacteria bacterium]